MKVAKWTKNFDDSDDMLHFMIEQLRDNWTGIQYKSNSIASHWDSETFQILGNNFAEHIKMLYSKHEDQGDIFKI